MVTKVQIPTFLKKIFNIYSVITVVIGVIAFTAININYIGKPSIAQGEGCCTNCYWTTRDGKEVWQCEGCKASDCYHLKCEYPEATLCKCHDYKGRPSQDAGTCACENWQNQGVWCNWGTCDLGSDPYKEPAPCPSPMISCGTSRECSGGRCPDCIKMNETGSKCEGCDNPTYIYRYCKDRPVDEGCPYSSTQAQVQEDIAHSWYGEITIDKGDTFNVGSFHNGTGQFASDTRIEVSGPSGFSYSCDTKDAGCNGHTLTAAAVGTYIVTVKTFDNGDFYPESECNAEARVIVRDVVIPERGFELIKKVIGKAAYTEGEKIQFDIEITNTGEVTIEDMLLEDEYNKNHLRLINITGKRTKNGTELDSANLFGVIEPQNPSGEFKFEDLTEYLGDLGVGEKYIITEEFVALTVNTDTKTCNWAYVYWEGLEEESEACIKIYPKDEPPTDL